VVSERRTLVWDFTEPLNAHDTRAETAEAIRELIDEVRMVPESGRPEIELRGDLAVSASLLAVLELRLRDREGIVASALDLGLGTAIRRSPGAGSHHRRPKRFH
jgi:hypothetical protein